MQFGVGISLAQNLNDLTDVNTAGVADNYIILYNSNTGLWEAVNGSQDVIGFFVISGNEITTGPKTFREVPFDCNIIGWKLVVDTVTSNTLKVSIQKTTDYTIFTEVITTENDKPQINNLKSAEDFSLENWNTTITKDEILRFTIDTSSNVKQMHFFLTIERDIP